MTIWVASKSWLLSVMLWTWLCKVLFEILFWVFFRCMFVRYSTYPEWQKCVLFCFVLLCVGKSSWKCGNSHTPFVGDYQRSCVSGDGPSAMKGNPGLETALWSLWVTLSGDELRVSSPSQVVAPAHGEGPTGQLHADLRTNAFSPDLILGQH